MPTIYEAAERQILGWTGLDRIGPSVAEQIVTKIQVRGKNSLSVVEFSYLVWRMFWEEVEFLEGLLERGRSVHNGDTFRKFHSLFGRSFIQLTEDPRYLEDHVLAVAFREALFGTFAVLFRVFEKVGIDVPASAVGRIVRLTPMPAMIPKKLGTKGVLLIWMHHPAVAALMREVFADADRCVARGLGVGRSGEQIRQAHPWIQLREGDPAVVGSESDILVSDADQMLLELI